MCHVYDKFTQMYITRMYTRIYIPGMCICDVSHHINLCKYVTMHTYESCIYMMCHVDDTFTQICMTRMYTRTYILVIYICDVSHHVYLPI